MSPVSLLFQSRKFWLLILDTVIAIVLYTVANFFPAFKEHVGFLVATLQPVFVMLIVAIAIEDAAEKRAGQFSSDFRT
jgi:uncharacterized membrane protein HdeD (DUF308 family)